MAQLKASIVLSAVDRATAPLKGLSRSAGGTQAALAKLGGQASQTRKLAGLRTQLGTLGSKLDTSRRKTAELGRELKRTDDPTEKLRKAFERSRRETVALARAHGRQRGELRDLSASLRRAGVDTRRLNTEQERLDRTSERLRRRLGRLGRTDATPRARGGGFGAGLAGGVLGSAAFAGARGVARSLGGFVSTASQMETLEATLGTIEGSSAKARKSMDWIDRFAATTPFQIDQVSEAFVRLRAYGMDPTASLRTLGDTASAMGKDVMQAVEAIADAVTGENERLKEFGIKARTKGDTITYEYTVDGETRTAMADARDRGEIQRTLLGIMDSRFGGAMEARMSTFSGMVSNLGDHWFRFQRMVMDSGPFELLKDRLRGVLDRINAMADSGDLQKLADRIGTGVTSAFKTFERDVWPVLKDQVWPALKDIAGVLGDIFKGANQVASAVGGWGNVLKAFAAYKGLRLAVGLGRGAARRGGSILEFGGDIKDALTSPAAKRMRGSAFGMARTGTGKAIDLGSKAIGAGKAGAGKALGGLARFGKTLGSLALRFAPLLMGALKALGAVFAGLSLPVTAAVVAIAGAAFLIWKYWEPIKVFFANLWTGIKAGVSAAWEKLSSIDWSGAGKRLMITLAKGIRSVGGAVWDGLKSVLGKLADLLPFSDARTGPLSRLTASGSAILSTLGQGVRRSGAGPLQRPLAQALGTAAAGLALSVPAPSVPAPTVPALAIPAPTVPALAATPAPVARLRLQEPRSAPIRPDPPPRASPATESAAGGGLTVNITNKITIEARPGESDEDLIDRLQRMLEDRQARAVREALGDAV